MQTLRLAAMFAVMPLAAAIADEPAPRGDVAKFQGSWKATVGPDKDFIIRLVFQGTATTFSLTRPDGTITTSKGEIKLDDAAKPHKTIDWLKFTGRDGDEISNNLGIYEIDGDTLKLCSGGPGNPRPTEFEAGDGGPPHLVVLTREARNDDDAKGQARSDRARFQGRWKTSFGPENNLPLVLTFKDNAVTVQVTTPDNDDHEIKGAIKLDEAAKPFKTLDWVKFVDPDGNDLPDSQSIYEFQDDDTIQVCTSAPGKDRPTELKAGAGGFPVLLILKRDRD